MIRVYEKFANGARAHFDTLDAGVETLPSLGDYIGRFLREPGRNNANSWLELEIDYPDGVAVWEFNLRGDEIHAENERWFPNDTK